MALMVVHSGTSGMESISDAPCYLVLNYLTWSLICITVHQNCKGRGAVLPHAWGKTVFVVLVAKLM